MTDLTLEQMQISAEQKVLVNKYRLQDIYKNSLYHFAKYCLGYQDITLHTHGRIIESLESKNKRKLIVCPRGAFKSSIGVISYALWLIINDSDVRILIDSELFTNSKNFIREIQAHIESERFITLFGNLRSKTDWTQSHFTVSNRKRAHKNSTITAGGVGTVKTGAHFTHIIADDLNSHMNSNTEDGRQKVIQHYKYYTSLLEPDGTIVVIGTRYAANDVIGYILETEVQVDPTGKQDSWSDFGLLQT